MYLLLGLYTCGAEWPSICQRVVENYSNVSSVKFRVYGIAVADIP